MSERVAWTRLVVLFSLVGVVFAPISWIVEGVTPSWVVFPILLLGGVIWVRRGGTAGLVMIGAVALAFLLVHLPFVGEALSQDCVNPVDPDRACHRVWWLVSLGAYPLTLLVAAILGFRERGGTWRIPRRRR